MKNIDPKTLLKAWAPRFINKALRTFDNAMLLVVGSCWAAAGVMVLLAFYSFWAVGSVKKDIAAAEAMEPVLPKIVRAVPDIKDMAPIIKLMEKDFPGIKFSSRGKTELLVISAANGADFRDWLAALTYLDTVAPDYRWSIREMCVGTQCGAHEVPLKAVLTAEKISFVLPSADNEGGDQAGAVKDAVAKDGK